MKQLKKCLCCSKEFIASISRQKFCSPDCALDFKKRVLNYLGMSKKEFSAFRAGKPRKVID